MTDVTASCQAPEVGDRPSLGTREASGWTAHDSFRVSVTEQCGCKTTPGHSAGGLHSELGATVTSPFQKRSWSFIELSNGISLSKPLALVNHFIGKFIISQSGQLKPVCKRRKSSNISLNSHKHVKASLYYLTSLQLHINSVKQQFDITY